MMTARIDDIFTLWLRSSKDDKFIYDGKPIRTMELMDAGIDCPINIFLIGYSKDNKKSNVFGFKECEGKSLKDSMNYISFDVLGKDMNLQTGFLESDVKSNIHTFHKFADFKDIPIANLDMLEYILNNFTCNLKIEGYGTTEDKKNCIEIKDDHGIHMDIEYDINTKTLTDCEVFFEESKTGDDGNIVLIFDIAPKHKTVFPFAYSDKVKDVLNIVDRFGYDNIVYCSNDKGESLEFAIKDIKVRRTGIDNNNGYSYLEIRTEIVFQEGMVTNSSLNTKIFASFVRIKISNDDKLIGYKIIINNEGTRYEIRPTRACVYCYEKGIDITPENLDTIEQYLRLFDSHFSSHDFPK